MKWAILFVDVKATEQINFFSYLGLTSAIGTMQIELQENELNVVCK
jgi:hypothetical protein